MAYSLNPNLPRIRAEAVNMVRDGNSIRKVARYYRFNPSTISRWCKKALEDGCYLIPTNSSRPKNHPSSLSKDVVDRIIALRLKTNGRCSEVIHQMLFNEGIKVSLSSVKRVLDRYGLIKKSRIYLYTNRSLFSLDIC